MPLWLRDYVRAVTHWGWIVLIALAATILSVILNAITLHWPGWIWVYIVAAGVIVAQALAFRDLHLTSDRTEAALKQLKAELTADLETERAARQSAERQRGPTGISMEGPGVTGNVFQDFRIRFGEAPKLAPSGEEKEPPPNS